MALERSGFRGLSGLYKPKAEERGYRGLGSAMDTLGPAKFVPTASVEQLWAPYDPPSTHMTTRSELRAMANSYRVSTRNRAGAIQRELKVLMQQTMPQCIGTKSVLDPSVMGACEKKISPERILTPLGVINVLDVPLGVPELLAIGEDGALERVYQPTSPQRFIAGYAAYLHSQWHIARILKYEDGWDSRRTAVGDENVAADADADGIPYTSESDRTRYGMLGVIAQTRGPSISLSINDFIGGKSFKTSARKDVNIPDGVFTYFWDGFPRNPIPPTPDELSQPGGLYRYYARGGYLLYKPLLDGANVARHEGNAGQSWIAKQELRYTSGYFMCADGAVGAATEVIPDEGKGWIAFVTFAPGQWALRIQMADRGRWASVGHAIKSAIMAAMNLLCKFQPMATAVAQASMSTPTCKRSGVATPQQKMQMGCTQMEIAAAPGTPGAATCDAKVYKCNPGEPNCVCTGPSQQTMMQQQAMIAAGSAVLAATCKALGPDPVIPCPPPAPAATTIPWWLIGIGAAGVGFVLYKRKQGAAT